MNILATQYCLQTKSLEIYIAGCKGPHCLGCHNESSWAFDQGSPWKEVMPQIHKKLKEFSGLIDNIKVLGGEPLDQDLDDLGALIYQLAREDAMLWLFTGKRLLSVPTFIADYCDYIKCERYDETQLTEDNIHYGIKLASANQKIYKKGVDY